MSSKPSEPLTLGILEWVAASNGAQQIKKVDKFSSAGKAGITLGDVVTGVNGKRLPSNNPSELVLAECAAAGVGGIVKVHITRAGREMIVPVTLVAKKTISLDLDEAGEVLERKISVGVTILRRATRNNTNPTSNKKTLPLVALCSFDNGPTASPGSPPWLDDVSHAA